MHSVLRVADFTGDIVVLPTDRRAALCLVLAREESLRTLIRDGKILIVRISFNSGNCKSFVVEKWNCAEVLQKCLISILWEISYCFYFQVSIFYQYINIFDIKGEE